MSSVHVDRPQDGAFAQADGARDRAAQVRDAGTHLGDGPPHPLTAGASPEGRSARSLAFLDGQPGDELIRLEEDLYGIGRKTAFDSGKTAPDGQTEDSLRQFAAHSARRLTASPFDPETSYADRLLDEKYRRLLAEEPQHKQVVTFAQAALREREQERATFGQGPQEPGAPLLVGVLGTLGIALSMTITLYDLFFSRMLTAALQAFVVSFLCGAVLAGAIGWGILGSASQQHARGSLTHWLWFGLGLLFGAALYLMRLSAVQTQGEHMLAIGFALMEVVSVLVLEAYARGLRASWARYHEQLPAYQAAEQQVEAARQHLDACQAGLARLEEAEARHEELVRRRWHAHQAAEHVVEAARSAILAGYHRGIEENRGYAFDRAVRPLSAQEVLHRGQAT